MSMTCWGFPVSANDLNAAVVLLAEAGVARDKLHQAITNAGGRISLLAAPSEVDAAGVLASEPAAVVIALDASSEDVLDLLEPVLAQAGVLVLLEEAELAAQREGWDAQRWERHLAAKLQGHGNVLPPGAEQEQVMLPQPGRPSSPEQQHVDASLSDHLDQALAWAPAVPADELAAAVAATPQAGGQEQPAPVFCAFDDFEYDSQPSTPVAMGDVRDVAPSLEELFASAPPAAATVEPVAAPSMPPPLPLLPPLPEVTAPAAAPAVVPSLSQWSLVDFDSSAAAPAPAPAVVADVGNWDLSNLSLLDLEQDAPAHSPAQTVSTVALLMAGIGGPDAIRRLLAELPAEGMPGAVLVQLRLDGGRYANLVAQLERVCAAPVQLAEVGKALEAGHVYVVADDITVSGDTALGFAALAPRASVLADMPATGSAVLMLSGADAGQVDAVLELAARGAWVAGQSGEGCYDPAAASALAVAGMPIGEPAWLARELLARWGL